MSRASSAALTLAVVAGACGSRAEPSSARALDRAVAAALASADHARTPWRCAAADTPELVEEDLAGDWHAKGHVLARQGAGSLAIGVIADAGGAAPATLAALGRLRSQLDAAHVGLVLALGGMGETQADVEATLGVIADHAGFPVVALAGDLEPAGAHAAAIAALRQRGKLVVDARSARWIQLDGGAIATVPGAGASARLARGDDGCGWTAGDLAQLTSELNTHAGLRILATAEAPRQTGPAGEASGEIALASDGGHVIDLHLHGPTAPAPSPGRAGGRDGGALALSPGTADATSRLPDAHRASAGLLFIHGGAWTWRPLVDAPAGRGR